MASLQAPGGSSKSAKFQAANPLAPIADPFSGLSDEQKDYHQALSESVNQRLQSTLKDMQEKHARGQRAVDDPDRAPTGEPYKLAQMQAIQRERMRREQQQQLEATSKKEDDRPKQQPNDDDDDDDDDDWLLEEDDPVLEAMRERRLREMRQAQIKRAENISKGHGQYRTITQDEFLPECTGSSEWVVVHFFHKEFPRCQIMDHHMKIVAETHVECKFIRLDAEKAPFFVAKLRIKVLPTVIVFQNGQAAARLVGFQGISDSSDEWPTSKLLSWMADAGAIQYTPPPIEVQQGIERLSIWRGSANKEDEDE